MGTSKMASWVETLAARPNRLCYIPGYVTYTRSIKVYVIKAECVIAEMAYCQRNLPLEDLSVIPRPSMADGENCAS